MTKLSDRALHRRLTEGVRRLEVPGIAVGIYLAGEEVHEGAGVTSVEHPQPVDSHTLFQIGSTTKTYTATALMRLVEQGRLALDEPVKKHVPELRLKDKRAERQATILQLLNHTAGWYGDVYESTGMGDDALARLVANMAGFGQNFPLGTLFSYNNISLVLAGRVIEKVTDKGYEAAVDELVLKPLGMNESFWFLHDVYVRGFAVSHVNRDDRVEILRSVEEGRGANPAGGLWSTTRDQIRYARFHLGNGRSLDGKRLLKVSTLRSMQNPTVQVPDASGTRFCGISWFINRREGGTTVGHGGNTGGQNHALEMVPEKDFAISVMTNSSPNGSRLQDEIVRWALLTYAGIRERHEPAHLDLPPAKLKEYAGVFSTEAVICTIKVAGDHLVMQQKIRPATLKALVAEGQDPPPTPPHSFRTASGDVGIVIDGPAKGTQFLFSRRDGRIDGLDMGRFVKKER